MNEFYAHALTQEGIPKSSIIFIGDQVGCKAFTIGLLASWPVDLLICWLTDWFKVVLK